MKKLLGLPEVSIFFVMVLVTVMLLAGSVKCLIGAKKTPDSSTQEPVKGYSQDREAYKQAKRQYYARYQVKPKREKTGIEKGSEEDIASMKRAQDTWKPEAKQSTLNVNNLQSTSKISDSARTIYQNYKQEPGFFPQKPVRDVGALSLNILAKVKNGTINDSEIETLTANQAVTAMKTFTENLNNGNLASSDNNIDTFNKLSKQYEDQINEYNKTLNDPEKAGKLTVAQKIAFFEAINASKKSPYLKNGKAVTLIKMSDVTKKAKNEGEIRRLSEALENNNNQRKELEDLKIPREYEDHRFKSSYTPTTPDYTLKPGETVRDLINRFNKQPEEPTKPKGSPQKLDFGQNNNKGQTNESKSISKERDFMKKAEMSPLLESPEKKYIRELTESNLLPDEKVENVRQYFENKQEDIENQINTASSPKEKAWIKKNWKSLLGAFALFAAGVGVGIGIGYLLFDEDDEGEEETETIEETNAEVAPVVEVIEVTGGDLLTTPAPLMPESASEPIENNRPVSQPIKTEITKEMLAEFTADLLEDTKSEPQPQPVSLPPPAPKTEQPRTSIEMNILSEIGGSDTPSELMEIIGTEELIGR